jgi:hypothetical protein
VVFDQNSLTIGVVLSIVISSILLVTLPINKVSMVGLLYGVLWVGLLLVMNIDNFMNLPVKIGLSIGIVFLYIVFAMFFSYKINADSSNTIIIVFKVTGTLLLSFGFLSLFVNFNFFRYELYSKSIFTFYEPSHFALVLNVIIISLFKLLTKPVKIIIVFLLFCFAIFYPSLIIFVTILLLGAISARNLKGNFLLITAVFIAVFIVLAIGVDFSYFTSRLDFSETTTNLSALIYMQGWHDAYRSLIETNGLGLGLQMAGTNFPSWLNLRIYDLAGGFYMNRNDGSFTASKLISEFGLMGVGLVGLYVKFFYRAYQELKKTDYTRNNKLSILINGIICSYGIEMFIRSSGYFTFGSLMLLTSLFVLRRMNAN